MLGFLKQFGESFPGTCAPRWRVSPVFFVPMATGWHPGPGREARLAFTSHGPVPSCWFPFLANCLCV